MLQHQPCPFAHPEAALAAWRRSFLGAVLDTASTPRFVLDYSRLMADPEGETARLVAFCRGHIPDYTPPADVQEHMARHLLPHRQHQRAENLSDVPCTSQDVEGYEAFLAGDQDRLNRALQAFPASSLAFDIDRVVHFYRREMATRDQHLATLENSPATLESHIADKDHRLTVQQRAKERDVHRLEARLAILETQLRELQQLTEWEVRSLKRSWSYRVGRVLVSPGSLFKMVYRRLKRMHMIPSASPGAVVPAETVDSPAELMAKYQRLTIRPLFFHSHPSLQYSGAMATRGLGIGVQPGVSGVGTLSRRRWFNTARNSRCTRGVSGAGP